MSAVFEARHLLTDRRFAIKWLLPELAQRADGVRRFVREAKVAGRVDHPNVVEIYDFGEAEDSFYMVMELLEGEPLDVRLQRVGRLSPAEACRILLPCMRGVARAHAAGVIHRDLKPGNIFLCAATDERPEVPKVLDFGISRVADDLDVTRDSPITQSGVWMGTPHYMSPEQVRGRPVDQRSDVYAFGVILYELLSGELPFSADILNELMVKVAAEDPVLLRERLPDIDPTLAEIVHRAMARVPAARFPDLDALVRALTPFAQDAETARAESPHAARLSPVPAVAAVAAEPPAPQQSAPAQPKSRAARQRGVLFAAGALLSMGLAAWLLAPIGARKTQPPAVSHAKVAATEAPRQAPAATTPPPPSAIAPVAASEPAAPVQVEPPHAPPPPAPSSAAPPHVQAPAAKPRARAHAPAERRPTASELAPAAGISSQPAAPLLAATDGQRPARGAQTQQRAGKAAGDAGQARRDTKPESLSGVTFDMSDFVPRAGTKGRAQATQHSSR